MSQRRAGSTSCRSEARTTGRVCGGRGGFGESNHGGLSHFSQAIQKILGAGDGNRRPLGVKQQELFQQKSHHAGEDVDMNFLLGRVVLGAQSHVGRILQSAEQSLYVGLGEELSAALDQFHYLGSGRGTVGENLQYRVAQAAQADNRLLAGLWFGAAA